MDPSNPADGMGMGEGLGVDLTGLSGADSGLSMADSLASAQDNLMSAGLAAKDNSDTAMGLDDISASDPSATMARPNEPLIPAAPVPGSIGSKTSGPATSEKTDIDESSLVGFGGSPSVDGVPPQVAPSPFAQQDTPEVNSVESFAQATEPISDTPAGDIPVGDTSMGNLTMDTAPVGDAPMAEPAMDMGAQTGEMAPMGGDAAPVNDAAPMGDTMAPTMDMTASTTDTMVPATDTMAEPMALDLTGNNAGSDELGVITDVPPADATASMAQDAVSAPAVQDAAAAPAADPSMASAAAMTSTVDAAATTGAEPMAASAVPEATAEAAPVTLPTPPDPANGGMTPVDPAVAAPTSSMGVPMSLQPKTEKFSENDPLAAKKAELSQGPKKKSKLPLILGIIGGVIALAAIIFVVVWLVTKDKPAQASTSTEETKPAPAVVEPEKPKNQALSCSQKVSDEELGAYGAVSGTNFVKVNFTDDVAQDMTERKVVNFADIETLEAARPAFDMTVEFGLQTSEKVGEGAISYELTPTDLSMVLVGKYDLVKVQEYAQKEVMEGEEKANLSMVKLPEDAAGNGYATDFAKVKAYLQSNGMACSEVN